MGRIQMKALYCVLMLCFVVSSCSRTDGAETRTGVAEPPGSRAAVTPEAVPDTGRPRVVFLGDSLTAGLGLEPSQSVPSLVQARLDEEGYGYEVVNAGVSGDTSAGGLRRLDWSLSGDVSVLVIELGANDGLRGLPASDLKKNLADIIAAAQGRRIKVLLTGMEAPPNYGAAYTTEFREVYQALARTTGVTFMPFYLEGVAGSPELNQRDGMHPNPDGARVVARNVWRALQPLLEKRSTR